MEKVIDKLGRIVIPKPYRDALRVKCGDKISISLEGERIILSAGGSFCVLCKEGNPKEGVGLCPSCIDFIKSL